MNEHKVETTIGLCVVSLTKHIMMKQGLNHEAAYKKLLATELYQLLQDPGTRLFLETNTYLNTAYDTEQQDGIAALYEYINEDLT